MSDSKPTPLDDTVKPGEECEPNTRATLLGKDQGPSTPISMAQRLANALKAAETIDEAMKDLGKGSVHIDCNVPGFADVRRRTELGNKAREIIKALERFPIDPLTQVRALAMIGELLHELGI